jgi:hypothetical protein
MGFPPLLALPGHLLDAGGVGRYLQWLSFAAAVMSVWWLARESAWAPFAACAVAITPHLFWQGTTAYDDSILVLAAIGLAAGVVRLAEQPPPPLLAGATVGALAGACVSFKLHLAPLGVGLAVAWLVARRGGGHVRAVAGAALGGLLIGGPPLAGRWVENGNPVFPLYNDIFKSDQWPASEYTLGFSADRAGWSKTIDVVLESATQTGELSPAAPDGSFGLIVAATLVAAALLWTRGTRDRTVLALWGGVLVATIAWFIQFRYLRFLVPLGVVSIAAIAVAVRGRSALGARAARVGIVVMAAAAALMWPSTVAQYWNVPDRKVPWKAALGITDDYDYERRSMPERDLIAAFDRSAPPDAMAVANLHQRGWLREGRDLTPSWELRRRLASRAAPPASDPPLVRYRKLGVTWVLIWRGAPFDPLLRDVFDLLAQHGELVYEDEQGHLYRLVDRPRSG